MERLDYSLRGDGNASAFDGLAARTGVVLPRALEASVRLFRPRFSMSSSASSEEEEEERPNLLEEAVLHSLSNLCSECSLHYGDVALQLFEHVRQTLPDLLGDEEYAEEFALQKMAGAFEAFSGSEADGAEGGGGGEEGEEDDDDDHHAGGDLNGVLSWGDFVVYLVFVGRLLHETTEIRRRRRWPSPNDFDSFVGYLCAIRELDRLCDRDSRRLFGLVAESSAGAFVERRVMRCLDPELGWTGALSFDSDRISSFLEFREWFADKI